MKTKRTWRFISNSLQNEIPVMLMYVLESRGSSPGRQGFMMAVNARGEMEGSIGGGIMEHKFVELAKEKLQAGGQRRSSRVKKQVHDKTATKDRSGMICSGEQTVLLFQPGPADRQAIEKILSILEQNKKGTLHLSPRSIEISETAPDQEFFFRMQSEDEWEYREKLGYKNHLFIIGGGHCALAFSKLMSSMDFYIHLFEERKGLNTVLQNEYVHEKHEIESYERLAGLVPAGPNHYVVIMTFGYRTDDQALRALLGKEFRYLGLLGSKKKIEKLFDDLKNEGVPGTELEKIYSPVGIDIKSETPEEIAVSIAAQIIKVKNTEARTPPG